MSITSISLGTETLPTFVCRHMTAKFTSHIVNLQDASVKIIRLAVANAIQYIPAALYLFGLVLH